MKVNDWSHVYTIAHDDLFTSRMQLNYTYMVISLIPITVGAAQCVYVFQSVYIYIYIYVF